MRPPPLTRRASHPSAGDTGAPPVGGNLVVADPPLEVWILAPEETRLRVPDELVDRRVVGHLPPQLHRLRCEVSPPHVVPGALEQRRLEGRRLLRVTRGAQTRTGANARSCSRPRIRPVPTATMAADVQQMQLISTTPKGFEQCDLGMLPLQAKA